MNIVSFYGSYILTEYTRPSKCCSVLEVGIIYFQFY